MSKEFPGFVPVSEYLKLPRDRSTWLIRPLIPVGGAALIYGQEKSGKSSLAIQLAAALCGEYSDWMGFPIVKTGPVLYLQLDNPRSTWADRFDKLLKAGLKCNGNFHLADRESIPHYPFDILQPSHVEYLLQEIQPHFPVAVIIDTLRESHSGDEDKSTISRNVMSNLVKAVQPAALIVVSHSRKPNPDADKDLMADHRGSSYITGRMDAIMRLTKNRLYYGGRSIEEGFIRLARQEADDVLLFEVASDDMGPAIEKVLTDTTLKSMRAKAKALAPIIGCTEEAAMSRIRRLTSASKHEEETKEPAPPIDIVPSS